MTDQAHPVFLPAAQARPAAERFASRHGWPRPDWRTREAVVSRLRAIRGGARGGMTGWEVEEACNGRLIEFDTCDLMHDDRGLKHHYHAPRRDPS